MDQLPAVNAALPYEDLGALRDVATISVADKVSTDDFTRFILATIKLRLSGRRREEKKV